MYPFQILIVVRVLFDHSGRTLMGDVMVVLRHFFDGNMILPKSHRDLVQGGWKIQPLHVKFQSFHLQFPTFPFSSGTFLLVLISYFRLFSGTFIFCPIRLLSNLPSLERFQKEWACFLNAES